MRNLEARRIKALIRHGSRTRCPACRSRYWAVLRRDDLTCCLHCGICLSILEFLDREIEAMAAERLGSDREQYAASLRERYTPR